MNRIATTLCLFAFLAVGALGQQVDLDFAVPTSSDAYTPGANSGARAVTGPYDLDGDGLQEVLLTDYTMGGRVHVLETTGIDTWELVYTTPSMDPTNDSQNARYAVGGDLDGDGAGEIIFFAGWGYGAENPNPNLVPGLYVFEHTGADNDYDTLPASIYAYDGDTPDRARHERIEIKDIDGDGVEEVLFANNGQNDDYDRWYAVSVVGDIGSGFESWITEFNLTSRTDEPDQVARGGGSPYSAHAGDFDGDGKMDLSLASWNSFNFATGRVDSANSYTFPGAQDPNGFLQAFDSDDVSLFGGWVVDINGDGDDEVFYPRYGGSGDTLNAVSIINYEAGEDALQITADNIVVDLLTGFSNFFVVAGDMDGDGDPELIGAGEGLSNQQLQDGEESKMLMIAQYLGGDVESPDSYRLQAVNTSSSADTLMADRVTRTDEDGGVTTFFRNPGGRPFPAKLAYLGDVDNDGFFEVALSLQSIPDSVATVSEEWSAADSAYTETSRVTVANEARVFLKVVSSNGLAVSIENDRVVVPDDYKLYANYPNPFNPSTTIGFRLPLDKTISLKVYDVQGRVVRTLINNQNYTEGTHQVTWDSRADDGNQVASGQYLYVLKYGNFRQTRSMTLIK